MKDIYIDACLNPVRQRILQVILREPDKLRQTLLDPRQVAGIAGMRECRSVLQSLYETAALQAFRMPEKRVIIEQLALAAKGGQRLNGRGAQRILPGEHGRIPTAAAGVSLFIKLRRIM